MKTFVPALLALLPWLVMFGAPVVLPAGTDPRGYGPGLLGALVGLVLSMLLGLAGAGRAWMLVLKGAGYRDVWTWGLSALVSIVPFLWIAIQFGWGRV